MSSRTFWPILGLVAALIAPSLARGQIIDGRVEIDTPYYVSQVVSYSVDAIRLVVPKTVVTSIINGDTLAGTNLKPPEPISLGVPGIGTLKINWEYTAIKMADAAAPPSF